MAYNIYLGDIDPNNHLRDVLDIRKYILFRLLLWDSIVLSDSQFLTDSRVLMMMEGFELNSQKAFPGLQDWHKGFELLLEKGLIEVAHRNRGEGPISMTQLWTDMNGSKGHGRVPYLPETIHYARYLDKLSYSQRIYHLNSIGTRFKTNLLQGVENGGLLLDSQDDTDREFKRMILENNVLFRDILHLLRSQLEKGKLTPQHYDRLYNYTYSCYSTNVPAETNCYFSTQVRNIPFHLGLGFNIDTGDSAIADPAKLRPTWVLDPLLLDLLSMESFLRIREAVQPCISDGKLLKYSTGDLPPEQLPEYYDLWAEYSAQLERAMRRELIQTKNKFDSQILPQYTTAQQRVKTSGINLVVNTLKTVVGTAFPAVGTLISVHDMIADVSQFGQNIIMLHKGENPASLAIQREAISNYLDELCLGSSIISKHQN